jgi:ribulose-5-phosphate 4-epimerase/fuculose-1-phosphate aldolase
MNNIMLVGGTFGDRDENKAGKKSSVVTKLSVLFNCSTINGGNISRLREFNFNKLKPNTLLIWMPNISNDVEKILPKIKKEAPHILLMISKRPDTVGFTRNDMIGKMLKAHAGLGLIIHKKNNQFSFELLDPLGNTFANTSSLSTLASNISARYRYLSQAVRLPSLKLHHFDIFDIPKSFISTVQIIGKELNKHASAVNPNRLFGNASTRCGFGFPAVRHFKNRIFVTRRNIEKSSIISNNFVQALLSTDGKEVLYTGDHKPSVDTPIQLKLFEKYPHIKYMMHGHCYTDINAPMTKHYIPCGDLREVADVIEAVKDPSDQMTVNLRGHGFLMMGTTHEWMRNIPLIGLQEIDHG